MDHNAPPPRVIHHARRAGQENLPLESLTHPRVLDIPMAAHGPVTLDLELETSTELNEKPYARRQFWIGGTFVRKALHGAMVLTLHFVFSIGSNTMNWKTIAAWGRQPTTIAGLATLAYVATGLFTKHLTFNDAWPLLSGAAVALGIKDNSSTILHQSQANGTALAAVPNPNGK